MLKNLICLLAIIVCLDRPQKVAVSAFSLTQKNGYTQLDSVDGAGIYGKVVIIDSVATKVYLQLIDMNKFKLTQIYTSSTNIKAGKGLYFKNMASPYFKMISLNEVVGNLDRQNVPLFSLINCSFFESYDSITQLSFPVKNNGKFISGGSSAYGPTTNAANSYYKHVQLYALTTGVKGFNISKYNPVNNFPLSSISVKEAIVTYRYQDHPALVLGANQLNRYTLLGKLYLSSRHDEALLAIITVNKAKINSAAELLHQIGVKGEILTVDGGTSTSLYNPKTGIIEQAGKVSDGIRTFTRLPHYLAFIRK